MRKNASPDEYFECVKVWRLTDPTSVQSKTDLIDQDLISISKNPFSAKRVLVSLENINLVSHESMHRVRTHTKIEPPFCALLITGPQSRGTIDGIGFRPDTLIAAAPGTTADLVVEAGYKSFTIFVPPDHLNKIFAGYEIDLNYQLPFKFDFKKCDEESIQSLFELGMNITSVAEKKPALFDESRAVRISAELEILDSLISAVDTLLLDAPDSTIEDRTLPNYSQIIKAVEAHTMENLDRQIFVRDLCQIAGVSERTLHGAFQEIMHVPPISYLRRLRLHRARSHLQSETKSTATVSSVALEWGFWHFGEFSHAYKECFGELPSKTLKRKHAM